MQKLRLEHKDVFIYGTAGISVLIMVIAFLLIRQNKIKTKQEIFELEQKQLRAQMNPHFIFNCLNSIQHFVVQNDVLNANKYLTDFASLMRKTLELSEGGTITLYKEIDYLNNYLLLEQMRFENKFSYEIKCDKSIESNSIEIPPMIVQPFAENAIRHGLRYLEGTMGKLTISFYKQGENMICEVDDNGIGRVKSQQLKTLTHIEYQSRGMELTQKRLELISKVTNSEFKIDVLDKKDEHEKPLGTKVIIKFPIQI
jgi:LytS/YehU family sensor histidine kinase